MKNPSITAVLKGCTPLLLAAALVGMLQGCLQQSDQEQQELDRENSYADALEKQYSLMKGDFAGTYNDTGVLLHLDVKRIPSVGNGDLNLVPEPTIYGALKFRPAILSNSAFGKPLEIPFPITQGQYASGNDLSLTAQENNSPTTVHCVVSNSDSLDCDWTTSAGEEVRFQLARVDGAQGLSGNSNKYVGVYEGVSLGDKITAEFEPMEDLQTGSAALPQASIAGVFTVNQENAAFKGAEYNFVTKILSIDINGANPIVINCEVASPELLHCDWTGRNGDQPTAKFDLVKNTHE